MLEYVTAGESHGPALTAIIKNYPAGVPVEEGAINEQLMLRQMGYGRGGRMKIEKDKVRILSGVRGGYTLGSPITLSVVNKDYANWESVMNPRKIDDNDLYQEKRVQKPRPGHADLPGALKYRHLQDIRNVLERSSARETAVRTSVGALCRQFLNIFGIDFYAFVTCIGEETLPSATSDDYNHLIDGYRQVNSNELRIVEPEHEKRLKQYLDSIIREKNTAGGKVRLLIRNVPPGLGSYTHWEERLDSSFAQLLMSIPAVKGIQIGSGMINAPLIGSVFHDEILYNRETKRFQHKTNKAGGIEGGISNGEIIDIQVTMKPIPTLMSPLQTVNLEDKTSDWAVTERSDVCAVPALSVVVENIAAFVVMRFFQKKFGMDHLEDIRSSYQSYMEYLSRV